MDIWQRGRQKILHDLNNAFDRIGADMATELDDEINALVKRDRLKDLKERAARVEGLEDEIEGLVRGKRALEGRVGELERQQRGGEIERLAEENLRLREEIEGYKMAADRVGVLEKENQRLAEQLRQSLETTKEFATPARMITAGLRSSEGPMSSVSRIEDDGVGGVTKEKYQHLVGKFNKLFENHNEVKQARLTLANQVRALKEVGKRYKETFITFETKNKEKNAKIKELSVELKTLKTQGRQSDKTDRSAMLLLVGDDVSDERVGDTEFEALEAGHSSSTNDAFLPTSPGRTIESEIKQEDELHTPMSQETPVVISSRSVRKRKHVGDVSQHIITPTVKIETITSSPLASIAALYNIDESLDLDDIGEKQSTPRKGRPSEQPLWQRLAKVGAIESQGRDRSHSSPLSETSLDPEATPTYRATAGRKHSALQPRSANKQILPRTSVGRPAKKRRTASSQAVRDLLEDGQVSQSIETSPPKRKTATPEQVRRLGDLLDGKSPPKQVLRSPAPFTPALPMSRRSAGGISGLASRAHEVYQDDAPAIAAVLPPLLNPPFRTRDLEEPSQPPSRDDTGRGRLSAEISRPSSKGSMRASPEPTRPLSRDFVDSSYFSRPVSRGTPAAQPASLNSSKKTSRASIEPQRPPSRDSITFPRPSNQTPRISAEPSRPPSRHSVRGSLESDRPSSRGPYQTPVANATSSKRLPKESIATSSKVAKPALRTRPLDQLTLQDFKVNPEYNAGGGHGFAYNEVVRKQAERACLQGCTKPECCGNQLRAMVEATRHPDQLPTSSQEEADKKTLEEYLGDNHYKLANMTDSERYETLMTARTREFANKHGRHRHAFEGRSTPPGRWRADFPTTQEEIDDRIAYQQIEKEEVKKRYEAAMRPGGAFTFRDE